MDPAGAPPFDADQLTDDAAIELVHADGLRFFPELASELGGDAASLLRRAGIDPAVLAQRKRLLGYRSMAQLMELAASELRRPDFGLRLAARQGGGKVFGPIGVVMRNSPSLGEALEFVRGHIDSYSLAARLRFEPNREARTCFIAFEILLDRMPSTRQVMEQALLLAHLNAVDITGGRARAREVHFRHPPQSPLKTYRDHFGCEVRFDQPADGIFFTEQDMLCPVVEPDEQLHEMATAFIDTNFRRVSPPMHTRVRGLIIQYLGGEDCTNDRVAEELCLHPRTLHRRLKIEGKSFEGIKDEVRRDAAMRYLQETDLPLTRIAEKLGYAETSVLSRSCFRWFGASPRQVRSQSRGSDHDDGRAIG